MSSRAAEGKTIFYHRLTSSGDRAEKNQAPTGLAAGGAWWERHAKN
jgi:hypothetical protein